MKRPSKVLLIKISASIGIVTSLLIVCWALWLMSANKKLKQAREEMFSSGVPANSEKLFPVLPEDVENSAPYYDSIFSLINYEGAQKGTLADWATQLRELQIESEDGSNQIDSEAYLQAWESDEGQLVWSMVRMAVERGSAVFGTNYEDGVNMEFPYVMDFLKLQMLLCEKVKCEVSLGNFEDGRETLLISLQVANALKLEPLLVPQLVRLAQFNRSCDVIPAVLSGEPANQAYLGQLREALQPLNDLEVFSRAVMGEYHFFGMDAFAMVESEHVSVGELVQIGDGGGGFKSIWIKIYRSALLRPLRREDQAHTIRMYTLNVKEQMNEQYLQSSTAEAYLVNEVPKRCLITRMMMPAYRNFSSDALASYRISALAVELYAYALQKQALPESLADLKLAEEMIRNPYTGKPITYEAKDGSFSLDVGNKKFPPMVIKIPAGE